MDILVLKLIVILIFVFVIVTKLRLHETILTAIKPKSKPMSEYEQQLNNINKPKLSCVCCNLDNSCQILIDLKSFPTGCLFLEYNNPEEVCKDYTSMGDFEIEQTESYLEGDF